MYEYIFSLTTIPSRFDYIDKTIDSLINQTIKPKYIVLNIPKEYNFRFTGTISEEKIQQIQNKYNIIINLVDNDYGPGTKLIGLLENDLIKQIANQNTYVVLVDCDAAYKPYMLEYFDNQCQNQNINAASFWTNTYANLKVGQGADGFFIQSNLLNKFLTFYNRVKHVDYLNYQDDLYISYYLSLLKTSVLYIKPPNNALIYDFHSNNIDALLNIVGEYSRNNVTEKIYNGLSQLNTNNCFDDI